MADIGVYFDGSGLGGTVGNEGLWADIVGWESQLPGDQYLTLHHLMEQGWEDDLPALLEDLGTAISDHPPAGVLANGLGELVDILEGRADGDEMVAIALNVAEEQEEGVEEEVVNDDGGADVWSLIANRMNGVDNAFNPSQPRVPSGRPGGGRFASVKQAGAAVKKAESRVAKAQLTLEKAKAALKVEKSGLVVAKRGLTQAMSREKGKSPVAKKAISKASAKEPVDIQKHLSYGKALLSEGLAHKKVKEADGYVSSRPTMPNKVYEQKVNDHVATLTKTLNKAQSIELTRGYGLHPSPSTTKKKALENVKSYLISNRGSFFRGLE